MQKAVILTLSTLAIACTASAAEPVSEWEIGPTIRGENYSVGMPTKLNQEPDGPSFDFPFPTQAAGHVHYVTKPVDSLLGASQIRLRYRVDAEPGVKFVARERPETKATVSLFFQRRGDDWTAKGRYETYRWYIHGEKMLPVEPGIHEITVDLKNDWKAVESTTAAQNPRAFRDALANADRLGFVFGSAGGRGHGVYATGRAKFTLLNFQVL